MIKSPEDSSDLWKKANEIFINNLISVESKLENLWKKIGLDDDLCTKRVSRVFAILDEVLEEMVHEENTLLSTLEKRVNQYNNRIKELHKDLHISLTPIDQSETLLLEEKHLKDIVNHLESKRKKAFSEWRQLDNLARLICRRIASPLYDIQFSGIPTHAQTVSLLSFTNSLEKELKAREAKFLVFKNEITELINTMEFRVSDDFLRSILAPNSEANFILSQENLNKVVKCKDTLERQFFEIKEKCDRLWVSIEFLWNLLGVDKTYIESFKEVNKKLTTLIFENLEKECSRLKKMRLDNLSDYIPKLKDELILAWNKSRFGAQKREQFILVYGSQVSEGSLAAHEDAIFSAHEYYKKNIIILQLLEKRDELWGDYQRMETNQTNAGKYQNRGGALLKEEKFRKFVYRELPRIDTELNSLISEWEEKNVTKFLIDDMTYDSYTKLQHDCLQNEKEERKKFRQMSRTPTITPVKKSLNCTISTNRLNSTMYRSRVCATEQIHRIRQPQTPIIPLTPIKRRGSFLWPNDSCFISVKTPVKNNEKQPIISNGVIALQNSNIPNMSNYAIVSPIYSKKDSENKNEKKSHFETPKIKKRFFEHVDEL